MTETPIPADRLFVIACPACRGELSASASCAGRTACCPLCTATFVLPDQRLEADDRNRHGAVAATVEPRRGTEDLQRSRRARRNLVFLLAGAAVLVGIVFVFAARTRR